MRSLLLKHILPSLLLLSSVLFSSALWAKSPISTSYVGNQAVSGYDSVAYFQQSKPVRGNKQYTFEYLGAKWLFSSQQNLDLFKTNPQKYAPQFGGYCAWAVAHGYTASADPTAWKIVDNKLYLNYNHTVKRSWEMNIPRYIAQGNGNWPRVIE
ncbi:YHS domain-containing (seleno)protein [Pelagibaculum spongiae]|uniref:YHS domain protein n=1 Tax=Pelagibaculum spongiae TaxID=2080658 RepID=A0A2V1GZ74_9GAMM|nr:YHS domain-containing (seleno)protein [Pelagibaculum spongiae]PVZ68295.1 YHS domain protein [Pelagibaculum spongiae]